ncbi:hypothetical protein RVR_2784 [Actinacidiphila reveromycinica]|uniref:Peptidoglycan binding-like domain-containing protein n=1 Tax=Actinacidiphila reveromycinica TaxID=659352 RepID=A0A7U3VN24_9ACTN|nr:peptidoglycan-binding domain-containing protein [Streptomyces sp. SN-593]BBA97164.1 hypothetical protein RVR_2784 [Streptomyces sp. SN-593]
MAPRQPSGPEDRYDGRYDRPDRPYPSHGPHHPPAAHPAPGGPAEDDAGGIRAAERSAERAAAVAAVEGFHPLRLRPYVAEPDGEAGETTVRRLIDTGATGATGIPGAAYADTPGPVAGGPAPHDLGLFPADGPDRPDDGDGYAAAAARGRHRRRKRGLVVAAAAVAASALAAGAVAVSGQIGEEQSGADRALPDQSSSMPDVVLPPDAAHATASAAPAMTGRSTAADTHRAAGPSATPSASATPPPAAGDGTPAARSAAPALVSGSASTVTATPPATSTAATDPAQGTGDPTQPTGTGGSTTTTTPAQVLEVGDSGPAVADLQRRLSEVWVYAGPIDGVFDGQVKLAVATFQTWYWVTDASDGSHNGVYGPNTRAALERQTQGDS